MLTIIAWIGFVLGCVISVFMTFATLVFILSDDEYYSSKDWIITLIGLGLFFFFGLYLFGL